MSKYQFFFGDGQYKTPPIDIDTPAYARELTFVLATLFKTNCQCFYVNDKGIRSFFFECLIDEND